MKKIQIYHTAQSLLLGLTITLSQVSCESLDQGNLSELAESNLPKSDADAQALVNASYANNITMCTSFMYLFDLTTETTVSGENPNGGGGMLGLLAWDGRNSYIVSAWSTIYTAIARTNDAIDKLEKNPAGISPAIASRVIGEAKFLRAYWLNYAVQIWGPVPIVTTPNGGKNAVRNSETEVYQQIVNDLEDAAERLPEASEYGLSDIGRATRGAANAALAKVYLTWAQVDDDLTDAQRKEYFGKSVQYAQKVIDSGKYHLLDKFIDNWSVDKKNGPEHIFSIEHDRTVNGNITGHCTFATNWSDAEPVLLATSDRYYEESDSKDQRRDGSWAKRIFNPNMGTDFVFTVPRFRKYIDSLNYANPASTGNAAGQSTNTTVIRYAEILLIKAEAENELNGPTAAAYDAINQIRRRAYWSPYLNIQNTPSDGSALELSGLSKEEFREKLREERRLEFILEGQRWFDLIRWHILVKYVKENTPASETLKLQNVSKRNYLLPLPQDQLILNPNLTQNWGYSGETGDGPYDNTFE